MKRIHGMMVKAVVRDCVGADEGEGRVTGRERWREAMREAVE